MKTKEWKLLSAIYTGIPPEKIYSHLHAEFQKENRSGTEITGHVLRLEKKRKMKYKF